jgi:hypothetical protein
LNKLFPEAFVSISISDVINGLASQQVRGLILVLKKAKAYAAESDTDFATLLAARLHPEMHPLSWQLSTTMEILIRGSARLTHAEVIDLTLDEANFDDLIARIESLQQALLAIDSTLLDQSELENFEIPVGPTATMPMTGKEYVLKFVLPNFYFHLTTSYDLVRMSGVDVGKRDFLGVS